MKKAIAQGCSLLLRHAWRTPRCTTTSPTALSHRVLVASVTASPKAGTMTAMSDFAAVMSAFLNQVQHGANNAVGVDTVVSVDVFE